MELSVDYSTKLACDILTANGLSYEHAKIVADHLVDAALSGHSFAGLPRLLTLVDHLRQKGPGGPVNTIYEGDCSAVIDGGDSTGYITSLIGIDKAIELAKRGGVGVVGVRNTWFSGRLAYYTERASNQGFIAFHTANVTARVAPYGGRDPVLGTNPISFSFPCSDEPLTIDLGTSATTWGEVLLRQITGERLDEGWAVDCDGIPTTDPSAALEGAILPWGGHRGYGLSLVAQTLGILAGSKVLIDDVKNCGFFFLVFDPSLLMPVEQFGKRVKELKNTLEASKPGRDSDAVRVPGESSHKRRRSGRLRQLINVDDDVYNALLELAAQSKTIKK